MPGPLDADVSARLDQRALELGQPAQDREHQSAMRGGGVCPTVVQALKQRILFADFVEHIEQVARTARSAVEPNHDQRVALAKRIERLAQLRPIRARALCFLANISVAPAAFSSTICASSVWPSVLGRCNKEPKAATSANRSTRAGAARCGTMITDARTGPAGAKLPVSWRSTRRCVDWRDVGVEGIVVAGRASMAADTSRFDIHLTNGRGERSTYWSPCQRLVAETAFTFTDFAKI